MLVQHWLPNTLSYKQGNEIAFIEEAYVTFTCDFIQHPPFCLGLPIKFNKDKTYQQVKEECFWHLISMKSATTETRIPCFERIERIPWVKPIIERAGQDSSIQVWENERLGNRGQPETRTLLLFRNAKNAHLIVLNKNPQNFFLLSSYPIPVGSFKLKRLLEEHKAFHDSKMPSL